MSVSKWQRRYMDLAHHIAQWSRDPSTKVGAVIVRADKTQVSFGYNGFPRGVDDAAERYADRDFKLAAVVHAEANAILNARESLKGHTIYCTFHPCARCASMIVQAGIDQVVIPDDPIPERWRADMEIAFTILGEGGVSVTKVSSTIGQSSPPL